MNASIKTAAYYLREAADFISENAGEHIWKEATSIDYMFFDGEDHLGYDLAVSCNKAADALDLIGKQPNDFLYRSTVSLIAAAPDLLEAAERLIAGVPFLLDNKPDGQRYEMLIPLGKLKQLAAAIAKAKGEA